MLFFNSLLDFAYKMKVKKRKQELVFQFLVGFCLVPSCLCTFNVIIFNSLLDFAAPRPPRGGGGARFSIPCWILHTCTSYNSMAFKKFSIPCWILQNKFDFRFDFMYEHFQFLVGFCITNLMDMSEKTVISFQFLVGFCGECGGWWWHIHNIFFNSLLDFA